MYAFPLGKLRSFLSCVSLSWLMSRSMKQNARSPSSAEKPYSSIAAISPFTIRIGSVLESRDLCNVNPPRLCTNSLRYIVSVLLCPSAAKRMSRLRRLLLLFRSFSGNLRIRCTPRLCSEPRRSGLRDTPFLYPPLSLLRIHRGNKALICPCHYPFLRRISDRDA